MKRKFTILDLNLILEVYGNTTMTNDCLPGILNTFDFEDVYETDDDSIVFEAGGPNDISIEFFNFNHPLKREINIMYRESGNIVLYRDNEFFKMAI